MSKATAAKPKPKAAPAVPQAPPAIEPLALKRDEAARALGVSLMTLEKLRADPEFPRPFRVGADPRWAVADLREWVRTRPRD